MTRNKQAIVIDFDGTFIKINSFELFVKYILLYSVTHFNLRIFIFLFIEVLKRKLRLESHKEMKKNILYFLDKKIDKKILSIFIIKLKNSVNNKVLEILKKKKEEGFIIILSSAAPEFYLNLFIQHFTHLFDFSLSTPTPKSYRDLSWFENIGITKCEHTIKLLQKNNLNFSIFMTDHYDDIPLLEIEKFKNIIVNPSEHTINKLQERNINYYILK